LVEYMFYQHTEFLHSYLYRYVCTLFWPVGIGQQTGTGPRPEDWEPLLYMIS